MEPHHPPHHHQQPQSRGGSARSAARPALGRNSSASSLTSQRSPAALASPGMRGSPGYLRSTSAGLTGPSSPGMGLPLQRKGDEAMGGTGADEPVGVGRRMTPTPTTAPVPGPVAATATLSGLAQPGSSAGVAQSQELVRELVVQISESMHDSLARVAERFGVEAALHASLGSATASASVPEDARALAQELHRLRRRERELNGLVDDLQTEQRVAKERIALYSILTLKLKRELVNEKLAHIDSKKEAEELRALLGQDASGRGGGNAGSAMVGKSSDPKSPANVQVQSTTREAAPSGEPDDEDPWTSPNKSSSDPTASGGGGLQLTFGSFYSSRQAPEDEDDDEPSSGLQPLRNSLMGQFLPSMLLDSPQLTPTARSGSSKPADNQEDDEDQTERLDEDQVERIDHDLMSFSLSTVTRGCAGCGRERLPVVEVVDCGHELCRPCERSLSEDTEEDVVDRRCPSCNKTILSLRPLEKASKDEDNQVDHLRDASRPSTSDSTTTAMSSTSQVRSTTTNTPLIMMSPNVISSRSTIVSPLTVSLLSEMFENIPAAELEGVLRDVGGQVSAAIERILQRHPAFNPALATEVPVATAPGVGSKAQPVPLLRSASSAAALPVQTSTGSSSNWKTEMCMYYLQGKCNKTRRTCSFAHGESDLVRSSSVKHTSSTSYKSRMCPLWLESSCPKSRRECSLAHGENDLRDGMALLNQNTGGSTGGGTPSSLVPPTLPTTAPRLQNYKTELCYYYLKGCCNYTKEECRFAHGESDLRTVESNTLEWSAQLANATAAATGGPPANQFLVEGYSSTSSAVGNSPGEKQAPALPQQPFQPQQFVQQFQSQPPPHGHPFAVPHHIGQAQFVSQGPQFHQISSMHPHQPQPPMMPGQSGIYGSATGSGGMPHQQQYRYTKNEDTKRSRGPPHPRRDTSWSQYDAVGSPDF